MDRQGRARVTADSQTLRERSATLCLLCATTCRQSLAVIADSKAAIARSRGALKPSLVGGEDRSQIN
jgi:hypothetical protein